MASKCCTKKVIIPSAEFNHSITLTNTDYTAHNEGGVNMNNSIKYSVKAKRMVKVYRALPQGFGYDGVNNSTQSATYIYTVRYNSLYMSETITHIIEDGEVYERNISPIPLDKDYIQFYCSKKGLVSRAKSYKSQL